MTAILTLDDIARKIQLIREGRNTQQIYTGSRTWNSQRATVLIALLELTTIHPQEVQVLFGTKGDKGWIGSRGRTRAQGALSSLLARGEVEAIGGGHYRITDLGRQHGEQCKQAKLAAARIRFDEIKGMIHVGSDGDAGEGQAPSPQVHGDDVSGL